LGSFVRERLTSDWVVFLLVGLIFVVGTIVFWRALTIDEQNKIDETTAAEAGMISSHVASAVDSYVRVLGRMADRWEFSGRPYQSTWMQAAQLNIEDFPGFESIQWMDSSYAMRWTAPADLPAGAITDEHTVSPERREALYLSRMNDASLATEPVELTNGEMGFVIYEPVYVYEDPPSIAIPHNEQVFDGFIIGTFNSQSLFDEVLAGSAFHGYSVAVLNEDQEIHLLADDDRAHEETRSVEDSFALAGREWTVRVWPEEDELSNQQSGLPGVALIGGLLLAAMMLVLVRLTQVSRRRFDEALELNDELQETTLALEESNRGLEEFAHVASHDLKAPLLSLKGMADILSEDYGESLPPDARQYLVRIVANATRMQNLLDDVLRMSRMQQSDEPATTVDLNDIVYSIVNEFSQTLKTHDASVHIEGALPQVQGNAGWLRQVFANLIDNAIKYSSPDRAPEIEIGCRERPDIWEVYVRDNGQGIPDEHKDKVFRMFQRLPNGRTANPNGSGMGLAIVARAIESNGGTIWIESSNSEGTTFAFTFTRVTRDRRRVRRRTRIASSR
jgi:signal transduction histidine kinase